MAHLLHDLVVEESREVCKAITLQLNPEHEAKLRAVAGQLKVSPEALAETAVRDLLAQPDEGFLKLAHVACDFRTGSDRRIRVEYIRIHMPGMPSRV